MTDIYPRKIKYQTKDRFTSKRRPYKKYNLSDWSWETVMQELLSIKDTDKNFFKTISNKFGIIESTLEDKFRKYVLLGKTSLEDHRGCKNKLFTIEQEQEMASHIKNNYIDRYLPFDDTDLKIYSLKKWKEFHPDNEIFTASVGWCTDFKKKWGISSVTPSKKRMSENNCISENEKFLEDCKKELDRVGPDNFWNMDETYWRTINMVQSTFGHTGADSTKVSFSGNIKLGFTSIFCINAGGTFLNPIVLKKGTTDRCLKSLDHHPGIQKHYTKDGWINQNIMLIILENIHSHSKGKNSVLILDQYSSHITEKFKEEAKKKNINIIYIPVGQTGKFQPLDVGINGLLKSSARRLWKIERLTDIENMLDHKGDVGDLKAPNLNDGIRHLLIAINKVINKQTVIKSFNKALNLNLNVNI